MFKLENFKSLANSKLYKPNLNKNDSLNLNLLNKSKGRAILVSQGRGKKQSRAKFFKT